MISCTVISPPNPEWYLYVTWWLLTKFCLSKLPYDGNLSFKPNRGGRDCDRLWHMIFWGMSTLFLSLVWLGLLPMYDGSRLHPFMVTNPTVLLSLVRSATRSLWASWKGFLFNQSSGSPVGDAADSHASRRMITNEARTEEFFKNLHKYNFISSSTIKKHHEETGRSQFFF